MYTNREEVEAVSILLFSVFLYIYGISALFSRSFANIILSIIIFLIGLYLGYLISGKKNFKRGYKAIICTAGILFFASNFVFFAGNQVTVIENIEQTKVKDQAILLANPFANNIIKLKDQKEIKGEISFKINQNQKISWQFRANLKRVANSDKILNQIIKFGSTKRWQTVVKNNLKVFIQNEISNKSHKAFFDIKLRKSYSKRLKELGYKANSIKMYNPTISTTKN